LKKTILIFGLCFAFASVGLQRVSAQIAPAPAPPAQSAAPAAAANNTRRASHPAVPQANTALQDSDETKVVRIYRGTGRFDLAMAEKLRPNLAKAFAQDKSPALPAAAIATGSAAPNPEISKKAPKSKNL
jgi:hypothetical protein